MSDNSSPELLDHAPHFNRMCSGHVPAKRHWRDGGGVFSGEATIFLNCI